VEPNGVPLVANLYIVEMALEPEIELPFGLTYILFATCVTCDTVDQIRTSACYI